MKLFSWGSGRRVERALPSLPSVVDPAFAEFISWQRNYSGVEVSETTALTLSAVYRAVALISQTIASLPASAVKTRAGQQVKVKSFLDNPSAPFVGGPTAFEFWETTLGHLLLHGNAFHAHTTNAVGQIVGLTPVHPLAVSVELRPERVYVATLQDGSRREFSPLQMTHIPGLSYDGIRGLSPIAVAANSIGSGIASERAASKHFANGQLISGVLTPNEDIGPEAAKEVKDALQRNVGGWENAGEVAVISQNFKFTPWTMSATDAQFLESRSFQVEEIARWFGIPPHALMSTEKATSWGTGIESQQRGLARTVLVPWARRIEQRISRLLPLSQQFAFDFQGLERGSPQDEIALLINQVNAGIITPNEARAARNLPPIEGGDTLTVKSAPTQEGTQ